MTVCAHMGVCVCGVGGLCSYACTHGCLSLCVRGVCTHACVHVCVGGCRQ